MLQSTLKRKNRLRKQRKARVRGKIFGTASTPRLSVYRSNRYFYAQVIDDTVGNTIAAVDGKKLGLRANSEDVKKIAQSLASKLHEKNVSTVVFDRNGYLYHGVVASFADALREAGIKL